MMESASRQQDIGANAGNNGFSQASGEKRADKRLEKHTEKRAEKTASRPRKGRAKPRETVPPPTPFDLPPQPEVAHLLRVSTLGELAGSLAHEINQPLTAILSNVQAAQHYLENETIDRDELRETLADIAADGLRAAGIVSRIRALVKKGQLDMQPQELGQLVRDVAALVHGDAAQRNVRVAVEIEGGPHVVHGDRVQLQQVVLNLMMNALDAVEACTADDRLVTARVSGEGPQTVRVSVSDRGEGIATQPLDAVFTPFFTSKPQGLGLGLPISRNIVTLHGGRLWAENNAARGATFHVSLPLEREAHATAARVR
ncbi:putative Histidine kinase [Paraburkholderia unamae]|uniref:sensor histidine kinase n=1 Tax=Paraburkholderia unamae TaxID=219649 RepID=UPI001CB014FE|nr:HAMP domain-containing sensor histidine kinase [Paraburkholderia unamae]CAG9259337.1 putative Histidine kinase [Paraburkholderia unamae]